MQINVGRGPAVYIYINIYIFIIYIIYIYIYIYTYINEFLFRKFLKILAINLRFKIG